MDVQVTTTSDFLMASHSRTLLPFIHGKLIERGNCWGRYIKVPVLLRKTPIFLFLIHYFILNQHDTHCVERQFWMFQMVKSFQYRPIGLHKLDLVTKYISKLVKRTERPTKSNLSLSI